MRENMMKITIKNTLLLLLALCAIVSLAACGAKSDPEEENNKAMLNDVYPANYKTIKSRYTVDEKHGSVVYAADGTAADGTKVMALYVKSSEEVDSEGAMNYQYDSQFPDSYHMIIVIDKATDKVIAYNVVREGANEKTYFSVPPEKIDAYKEVVISSETAFDDYREGLVTEKLYDTEINADKAEVITGTSLIYTGATVQGTFSSQLVRRCFETAARFYVNNK
jgi:hypothetical protein